MKERATMMLVSQRMSAVYVSYSYGIRWKNPDGSLRTPEESKKTFLYPGVFWAAGRPYTSIKQLCAKELDEHGHICRDIYGREVFAEWERFPCFDSYDYLYENRYYRWFFIRSDDQLTLVHYTDERNKIEITEDVKKLPDRCWKAIQEHKWQIEE